MSELPRLPCKPGPSTSSGAMNFPSFSISTSETNSTNLGLVLNQQDKTTVWVAPNPNLAPCSSLKERLIKAISHFQSLTNDKTSLVQIWVPVKRGVKSFLTTAEQPFSFDPSCTSLAKYRNVSESYEFPADEDHKEGLGLLGRVFVGKQPEWTPDVRLFRQDEYRRWSHAQTCDVRGSIAFPVFEKETTVCLAVLEIVTISLKISYRPEAEIVRRALEAVDLRSSEILRPPKKRVSSQIYLLELSEISHIIRTVCEEHGLPLAQTWSPYIQQSRDWLWNTESNTHASIIPSACCLLDQTISSFHEACLDQQLFRGQGVVGKAFMTNQPCYAIDVAAYSKAEYPLSHHAKMFGLRGSVAVHLQHLYGACESYVLEFFLPIDCQDPGLTFHFKIIESLTVLVRGSRSLCLLSGKETRISVEDDKPTSWISNLVEAQRKGKEVSLSFQFGKGRVREEEFKVTNQWSETNVEAQRQVVNECGGDLGGSSFGSDYGLASTKPGEKKRTKSQKVISLEVLKQYFAGSLKDAAKSLGVCPTTLKRICRQYGINRWPSRKIKKVDHSLKKLQLVIDSVKGAKGSIQLASFYSDFPQLSPQTANINDPSQQINALPENTMISSEESSSESTSSSQTTSSSHTFSTGGPVSGDTLTSQDQFRPSKRARTESELPLLYHSEVQRDGSICKFKATFREEMIRLTLTKNTGFGNLQLEIARRFQIEDVNKMHIKYLDDDKEWVLLTCDEDLEECIDIQRLSGSQTVKLSVYEISFWLKITMIVVAFQKAEFDGKFFCGALEFSPMWQLSGWKYKVTKFCDYVVFSIVILPLSRNCIKSIKYTKIDQCNRECTSSALGIEECTSSKLRSAPVHY
ncbi:uncharacterized protein [Phyllobates terribilis]|uniref:uncharacterized protein n=1 Tax=Phyllobates terribilis TaxID=111132 RepID=UPI003CCAAC1F